MMELVTTASPTGQRIAIIHIIPWSSDGLHYDIRDMINGLPTKHEDLAICQNRIYDTLLLYKT